MGLTILIIVIASAIILILLAIAIMIIRALIVHPESRQPQEIELAKVDGLDLAAHLAEVIQCQTISMDTTGATVKNNSSGEINPFDELHEILFKNYPLVSRKLTLERINNYSLLYTWPGSVPHLPAVLFAAHQDVVPVDESSLDQWDYPPFAGAIAEGYVWGRGAMDIKCQMTTLLDAVEYLLKQGFEPRRTVYLAFGHDEETRGSGAKEMAALLKERGVRLGALVDEGASVMKEGVPGFDIPVALIGTGEKGSLTLELSVDCPPGHSSAPADQTSIGILSKALARLEANPMPASLQHVKPLLSVLAPYSTFLHRLAFTNLWMFGGTVKHELIKSPQTNALLRTTTAVTMIEGGIKVNILPPHAAAKVNFRLAPGDTVQDVVDHVRATVADTRVKIDLPGEIGREASLISPSSSPAYSLLCETIQQIFGVMPVAPTLVTGATDARHYALICQNIYRFTPAVTGKDDTNRVHGIGERISVENLERMTQFFIELIQNWSYASAL
ncbi:MAG: M20 family peptidase [Chloroflexi bacterium]|nr:M20 family peptidase [Chloroflexota bacterium]